MNNNVIKAIKQWEELYYELINAEDNGNDELFKTISSNMRDLENVLSVVFDYEDRFPQNFIQSLNKVIDNVSEKEITQIKTFEQFKNMFNWDKEKLQLFNMLSAFSEKEWFMNEYYNVTYIEVDNFKFVVW